MKDAKTKNYLGIVATRVVITAGLAAAAGAIAFTGVTVTAPPAFAGACDGGTCNVGDGYCNTGCNCQYYDWGSQMTYGCYKSDQ